MSKFYQLPPEKKNTALTAYTWRNDCVIVTVSAFMHKFYFTSNLRWNYIANFFEKKISLLWSKIKNQFKDFLFHTDCMTTANYTCSSIPWSFFSHESLNYYGKKNRICLHRAITLEQRCFKIIVLSTESCQRRVSFLLFQGV